MSVKLRAICDASRVVPFIAAVLAVLSLLSCGAEPRSKPKWDNQVAVVDADNPAASPEIHADIYVDATESMKGFVSNPQSVYTNFIDDLEIALSSVWKTTDLRYFKFGTSVRGTGRSEYLGAKRAAFYDEAGISGRTSIDRLINRADTSRVTIILTDLFQNDGDLSAVASSAKDRCFTPRLALLLLPIPSQFDGTVFDARVPPYHYASGGAVGTWRPFYMMAIGKPGLLTRLLSALNPRAYIDPQKLLLVSPYIVSSNDPAVTKAKDTKAVVAHKRDPDGVFAFDLREGPQADLLVELPLTFHAGVSTFRPQAIEVFAERWAGGLAKQVSEVVVNNVTVADDRLRAECSISVPPEKGVHDYRVTLRTGSVDGFEVPDWVGEFSSDNPSAGYQPNRTLNLQRFVSGVMQSNSAVNQPALAQFFVKIKRT